MERWYKIPLSRIALLSIGLTATAAVSQTKPTTTSPAKNSPSVAARTVPTIKCTDPDTMAACESFKQLVDARDQRIFKIVMGRQSKYYRHFAYICLREKFDEFKTVDFDLPKVESYRPYSYYLSDDVLRRSEEQFAFLGPSTPNHPVDPAIQDQWFNEHLNQEVYDFGDVNVHQYRNGLHEDWELDYGKWSRLSEMQSNPAYDAEANFEGAYVWLETHTGGDKDSPDIGDDPEHAHISIVDGNIHAHYRFESKTGVNIHVQLNIQESTGRFTQTVIVPALSSLGPVEDSGTCMMFKR
jgi:hypothetical protein